MPAARLAAASELAAALEGEAEGEDRPKEAASAVAATCVSVGGEELLGSVMVGVGRFEYVSSKYSAHCSCRATRCCSDNML